MKQVFSMEKAKEIDKQTKKSGIPSIVLMENAAEGILNEVVHKEDFIIFCGIEIMERWII